MLKIYNTLGKKLEEFKSIEPNKVRLYVCGPTVYWYLHVGNFRGPVFFNFVRNWLEHLGYEVEYALNFTDVDDKIIKRAIEENKTAAEVSEFYIEEYKKDFSSLGLRSHEHNPKVTEYMPAIINMITDLVGKNKAYVSDTEKKESKDVHFSIDSFDQYGKLSGRKTDELIEGVRIDVSEKKKNALDFALWKSAKESEPSWSSPWGNGRPGWHIECSAMIKEIYGNQIDIHGGGLDLLFPHHENEIAQSEACHNEQFVRYWMHVNMLNFGGTKMSKSLGNVVTMRDFLKEQHSEVYKWMILSVHYRSVADFSEESIERAIKGLAKFYSALALAESVINNSANIAGEVDAKYKSELEVSWSQIENALNEDFGTPAAFAICFENIRNFNNKIRRGMKVTAIAKNQCEQFSDFIKKFGKFLSLFQEPPALFLQELDDKLLERMNLQRADINNIVTERQTARSNKDFSLADQLRKKLTDMGISVSDLPEGSFWEVNK